MLSNASPDLYLNMHQFADLKLSAREQTAEANRSAAQQFEALFVQMMLKDMRAAATVDPSQHSSYTDFYQDMHDKQLSLMLAKQGGMGIADMIEKQLERFLPERQDVAATAETDGLSLANYRLSASISSHPPLTGMNYQPVNPAVQAYQYFQNESGSADTNIAKATAPKPSVAPSPALTSETLQPFHGWDNADEFVHDLWPHAEKAAAKLGISTEVLVAQSALETGWGRYSMRKEDGSIAFNLFGIKAGSDWIGASVNQNTHEFRDGEMRSEQARFRAYDSLGEALDDYVDFVQSRERYQPALNHRGNDEHYIRQLHRAGYATDPNYADKVLNIMNGSTFNQALAALPANQTVLS